jgi:hypothetical protein
MPPDEIQLSRKSCSPRQKGLNLKEEGKDEDEP